MPRTHDAIAEGEATVLHVPQAALAAMLVEAQGIVKLTYGESEILDAVALRDAAV